LTSYDFPRLCWRPSDRLKVLVLDVGGTHVKVYRTGRLDPVKIASGPTLTPCKLVKAVQKATGGWSYDVVSIGYPGPELGGRPLRDPAHTSGWRRSSASERRSGRRTCTT
jgi:hypothetical protein